MGFVQKSFKQPDRITIFGNFCVVSQKFVQQGMVAEIEFDKVVFNATFDEGTFELPKKVKEMAKKKAEKEKSGSDK